MKTSIRDSQFLNVYGVGSMIDVDQQVMMPTWDVKVGSNPIEIQEPILVQRIKRRGFENLKKLYKLPAESEDGSQQDATLSSVIFPQWMYCPKCGRLDSFKNWRDGWQKSLCNEDGPYPKTRKTVKQVLTERFGRMPMCCHCREKPKKKIRGIPRLIPMNYVSICEHGHIDDFPWDAWCHLNHSHDDGKSKELYFESHGELNKQRVRCGCGAARSMADLFGKDALEKNSLTQCSGAMPWKGYNLPNEPFRCESCDAIPRAVQRNGTNIRFPRTLSAFSVPLGIEFDRDAVAASPLWPAIKVLAGNNQPYSSLVNEIATLHKISEKRVKDAIVSLLNNGTITLSDQDYEKCEYEAFLNALSSPTKYFEVEKEGSWENSPSWLMCLNKVIRLREISVPISFTRVYPDQDSVPAPAPDQPSVKAIEVKEQFVATNNTEALYACEGFGEGVFISFDAAVLSAWYDENEKKLEGEYRDLIRGQRHGSLEKKYVLLKSAIHTLVHCLMIQMSVESGYALTALRERIYCSTDGEEYYGALIFTTSADKCGTLGGVSRYADKDEFMALLQKALLFSEHCDNDPLCSDHPSGRSSKSSCFACVFLPETSCAHFNQWLDRKLMRNWQSSKRPWIGLFNEDSVLSASSGLPTTELTDEDPIPGCSYLLNDGTPVWGYDASEPIDRSKLKARIVDEND